MLRASPRLRRLLVAYTINRLGNWFGLVALAIAVYDHTHSAVATAGLFIAAQFLPALSVPAVVARVEMSPRRGILTALFCVEAVSVGLIAILLSHFWLPAILLLVVLDGSAAMAANALLQTAAADFGGEDLAPVGSTVDASDQAQGQELGARRANAMLNSAFSVTFVLGPPLAGVVVAAAGARAALVLDVVSFLLCGAMLLDLRPRIDEGVERSVRQRLTEAARHLRAVPQLRNLLIVEFVALIFFESIAPVEVLYAKATLAAGDSGYGFLMGSWGIGMVVGGVIFGRVVRRPLGPLLTVGTLAVGVAYLGLAASPTLLFSCCVSVVGGIGNGVQWASLISAVQRLTPRGLHGRLMGAVQSIGALAPAIGLTLGGAIAALASPRAAFWVAGVAATASTIVFSRITAGPPFRTERDPRDHADPVGPSVSRVTAPARRSEPAPQRAD